MLLDYRCTWNHLTTLQFVICLKSKVVKWLGATEWFLDMLGTWHRSKLLSGCGTNCIHVRLSLGSPTCFGMVCTISLFCPCSQVCNKIIFLMSFVGNCGTFTRGYRAMVLDVEFLYHLLYLLICAMGLFVHEFFYSLLVSTRCGDALRVLCAFSSETLLCDGDWRAWSSKVRPPVPSLWGIWGAESHCAPCTAHLSPCTNGWGLLSGSGTVPSTCTLVPQAEPAPTKDNIHKPVRPVSVRAISQRTHAVTIRVGITCQVQETFSVQVFLFQLSHVVKAYHVSWFCLLSSEQVFKLQIM